MSKPQYIKLIGYLISALIPVVTYLVFRKKYREFLLQLTESPIAADLFGRVAILMFFYAALDAVFGHRITGDANTATMEWIWRIGENISQVIHRLFLIIVFLGILTTLKLVFLQKK